MKLTIEDGKELAASLRKLKAVSNSKHTLPILGNVRIRANGSIDLTATDLSITLKTAIAGRVELPGETTIPIERLLGVLDGCNGPVAMETEKDTTTVGNGGQESRITGLPVCEWPVIETDAQWESKDWTQVNAGELKRVLASLEHAQSIDDRRYVLNGIYFESSKAGLLLVATDGRRLAMDLVGQSSVMSESFIVPAAAVGFLAKQLPKTGTVEITRGVNFVNFIWEQTGFTTKVIEGTYPTWRAVMPKGEGTKVSVNRKSMLEAVRALAKFQQGGKSSCITLSVGETRIQLVAHRVDAGEMRRIVDAQTTVAGPFLDVGFNVYFLREMLAAMTGESVEFGFDGELPPMLAKCGTYVEVLMPMRLA